VQRRKKQSDEMSFFGHFKEMRKVLLFSAYAIAIGAIAGWAFSDYVFRFLAIPMSGLSEVHFITTTPMEPLMVKLKVSLIAGVVIALPIIIWQLWSFILPALKSNERKYLYFIFPSSLLLFFAGAAFVILFVLPICLKFLLLAGIGAIDTTPFVTKSSYINFVFTLALSFGLFFQLPVVLILLIRIGVVSPQALAKYRKWAFFVIVILAVVLSPTPDLMTQVLIIGPMYLLYEISIWIGYIVVRRRTKMLKREEEEVI